ncbi:MAG: hypothetical protein A2W28_12730 [Gammaproteobacteria bacterium RBG_16_51_14]|nr:MAG: hypothetical protein A2W28_12730 [Gammaproteobacteria bacterium RBG_16_51_14]
MLVFLMPWRIMRQIDLLREFRYIILCVAHVLLVLLIVSALEVNADDWPVAPTTNQHSITGTIGETRFTAGNPRYHQGTDITDGTNVFAVNAGNVDQINAAGFWDSFVRIGTTYYYHISATVPVGTAVNVGDQIGTMRLDGPVHVHLQRGGTNFLAGVLNPFVDNTNPSINAYSFRQNPHNFTTDATQLTSDDLYGKVDIVVNAQDTRLDAAGNDNGGATAPYNVQYELMDAGGATIETVDYIEFVGDPPNASASHVFGINSTTANFNWVVTNNPFTVPYNRYWNTKGRRGTAEDWSGNPNLDARINDEDEATYPDGRYDVRFSVRDIDNDATSQEVQQTEPVIVDNYKPYVKKLDIGAGSKYLTEWQWQSASGKLLFVQTISKFIAPGAHVITIEFSEPVISPLLSINTFPGNIALTSAQPTNQTNIWSATLNIPTGDSSHDGTQQLSITATDLSANALDGQPGSIATRDNAGVWSDTDNGGDHDRNHQIRIDATPPSTSIGVKKTP